MQLIQTTIKPPQNFASAGGLSYIGSPSRALRRRMRVPEKLTVSEWAERHRVVTKVDSDAGEWRIDLLPWLKKPMDAVSLPYVREVWMCAPERAGKTQLLMNTAFWGIDQGSKGGSIFWLMPREKDARDAMGDRIIPAMCQKDSLGRRNRIARYISDKDDDTKRGMIRFNHGLFLRPAWSNSAAALASYFGFINIADEVDKFETTSKEGTNPVELFRKRARDDRGRSKYVFVSTPGSGRYVYSGVMECDQVWQFHLRCPDCDELVQQTEEHLDIAEATTVDDIKKNGCKIACPACGSLWDDHGREQGASTGAWICIKGEGEIRPETVGFHMSGFTLPKIRLKELGQKWLATKNGTIAALSNWAQGYRCEDYEPALSDRKEDVILRLCDDRYSGVVHPDSDILTIHADTQDKGFWYEIRGWQYGPSLTSWLVKAGYVPSERPDDFSSLDKLIFEDKYHDPSGKEYLISYGIIDSGGHRTGEVYDWCKRTGIFASKGAKGRKAQPVTWNNQEFFPHNNRPIPGGLKLYNLDTHFHKDLLVGKLEIDATDPGAWVLHSGYSEIQRELMEKSPEVALENGLATYVKHFTAEYRDEKGLWQCSKGKRNDLWDCAQMGIALARYLGFHKMVSDKGEQGEELVQQKVDQSQLTGSTSRPSWFNNRRR